MPMQKHIQLSSILGLEEKVFFRCVVAVDVPFQGKVYKPMVEKLLKTVKNQQSSGVSSTCAQVWKYKPMMFLELCG